MRMNKLICLALIGTFLLAGCGRSSPTASPLPERSTPTGLSLTPTAEDTPPAGVSSEPSTPVPEEPEMEVRMEYSSAHTFIPGLYLPQGLSIEGSRGHAYLAANLPCEALFSALAAGEWNLVRSIAYPWVTSDLAYLGLLERSTDQYLLRGSSQTFDAPTEEWGAEESAAPQGWQVGEAYCTGSLVKIFRQPVTVSGWINEKGVASQIPFACSRSDNGAKVELLYEGPGELKMWISLDVPRSAGEYLFTSEDYYREDDRYEEDEGEDEFPVSLSILESLAVSIVYSDLAFLDSFEQAAEGQLADDVEEGNEYFPAYEGFEGKLVVFPEDSGVISGELRLKNLEHGYLGEMVNIQVEYACAVPPVP